MSCVDRKPIDGAQVSVVEADADPNKKSETLNYYTVATDKQGKFSLDPLGGPYWTAKITKPGYSEAAVRYDEKTTTRDVCLEPKK